MDSRYCKARGVSQLGERSRRRPRAFGSRAARRARLANEAYFEELERLRREDPALAHRSHRRFNPLDAGDRDACARRFPTRISRWSRVRTTASSWSATPTSTKLVSAARSEPASLRCDPRGYDVAVALAPRSVDLQLVGATRREPRRLHLRAALAGAPHRAALREPDHDFGGRSRALRARSGRELPHEVAQLLDLVGLAGAQTASTAFALGRHRRRPRRDRGLPPDPIVLTPRRALVRGWEHAREHARAGAAAARLRGRHLRRSCPSECDAYAAFEARGIVVRRLPFFNGRRSSSERACVVTVDTGATHVASAMRRPTLVAFEHRYFRLNSQEWAPYDVPNVLVRKPGRRRSVPRAFRARSSTASND